MRKQLFDLIEAVVNYFTVFPCEKFFLEGPDNHWLDFTSYDGYETIIVLYGKRDTSPPGIPIQGVIYLNDPDEKRLKKLGYCPRDNAGIYWKKSVDLDYYSCQWFAKHEIIRELVNQHYTLGTVIETLKDNDG